jgi:long-chain acyl-CoA synthetase
LKHEKIFEAACIGVKREDGSETIKLYVSLMPSETLTDAEVIEYCRLHLTAYKIPKIVEFIGEIPKSNVGKILRRQLREEDGHS